MKKITMLFVCCALVTIENSKAEDACCAREKRVQEDVSRLTKKHQVPVKKASPAATKPSKKDSGAAGLTANEADAKVFFETDDAETE